MTHDRLDGVTHYTCPAGLMSDEFSRGAPDVVPQFRITRVLDDAAGVSISMRCEHCSTEIEVSLPPLPITSVFDAPEREG